MIFLCRAPWERKQIPVFHFGVQVKYLHKDFKFSIASVFVNQMQCYACVYSIIESNFLNVSNSVINVV